MSIALVGYTGFVGSNIYSSGKDRIEKVYNSKNIREAYGTEPELLIYAGMRAEKYLANNNPAADMELIYQAEENIRRIAPKKLVLISTIDVFKDPNGKNEDAEIDTEGLQTYGLNRYRLEQMVRKNYADALIIRLPGVFGKNIKKNFLYDYIHVIPFMLKKEKFSDLAAGNEALKDYYELQSNGFYRCRALDKKEEKQLKEIFQSLGFTALNFTDSRNVYQFYPLSRLWDDIQTALANNLRILHPATESVSAGEVYQYLSGRMFVNETSAQPVYYDYRTKYAALFGGSSEYLMTKEQVLKEIRKFVEESEG